MVQMVNDDVGDLRFRSQPADTNDIASTSDAVDGAVTAVGERLERTGRRWLVWSFILCPCHLPWTLAILTALFGGSAIGAFVNQNRTTVGIAIAVIYFIGVAIGFNYLRKAKANGACKVRF